MQPTERRNALLKLYEARDAIANPIIEGKVACKKGCNHCCYPAVGATKEEGAILSQMGLQFDDVGALQASLGAWLLCDGDHLEYMSRHLPCAYLGAEGECTAYEHRPLLCRIHNSTDVERCKNPRAQVSTVVCSTDRLFSAIAASLDDSRKIYLLAASVLHSMGLLSADDLEQYRMGR